MTRYEAKKYQGYARECLRQAEAANTPDAREKLVELSRVWMEAALSPMAVTTMGFMEVAFFAAMAPGDHWVDNCGILALPAGTRSS